MASYEHAHDLVRAHGYGDGLIYASSMVMLDSARRRTPVPVLARWLFALGIAATLAANVAHGLGYELMGAAVAAWPVALVGPHEWLMMVIRGAPVTRTACRATRKTGSASGAGAEVFADQLAAAPSLRL